MTCSSAAPRPACSRTATYSASTNSARAPLCSRTLATSRAERRKLIGTWTMPVLATAAAAARQTHRDQTVGVAVDALVELRVAEAPRAVDEGQGVGAAPRTATDPFG